MKGHHALLALVIKTAPAETPETAPSSPSGWRDHSEYLMSSMRIALAGAGIMGKGMGQRLLAAGYALAVMSHRNRANIDALVSQGAREAQTLADLVEGADIVILCLPDTTAARTVIEDFEDHLKPGQIVMDMGTSEPALAAEMVERLGAKGCFFADAPVAGGAAQAAEGTLGALVGATPDVLERITPVLSVLCARISPMGPPGSGAKAKLISNYLVVSMVASITETFQMARKADVDWSKLYGAMLQGSNNSVALQRMVEPALSGNYEGYRFSVAHALKDLKYFLSMTETLGGASPSASAVLAFYEDAVAAGKGDWNVSRLLEADARQD